MKIRALLLIAGGACTSAPLRPMTSAELLYRAKCTSCHAAYAPSKFTPKGWSTVIDKMEAERKIHLQPEERAEILQYLAGDAPAAPTPRLR